jgi:hypothetical protein
MKDTKSVKELQMNSALKNGIIASIVVSVVACLGTVAAQDVIVKQGTIGTGYPSPGEPPEPPKAKVFISDGADHATVDYGLLTVTTDATGGTDYTTGLISEFFPDASQDKAWGYSGRFRNSPVGTEFKNSTSYYGLSGWTGGMPDAYTISGKSVSFCGMAYGVENANHVVGGPPPNYVPVINYKTYGVFVSSQPVNAGYDMTGGVNFKNYGIYVQADLDGDYQAALGTGENYGVRIVTSDKLDSPATKQIKSFALWLEPFVSTANLGPEGETWGIYQAGPGVMNYFEGIVSAEDVINRTPAYTGTPQDALNEILNTRSIDGKIDHSSLPVMARATLKRVEKTNVRLVEQPDPSGKMVQVEEYDTTVVEEEGQSLGAMITVLTEAVKGLNEKIEALKAENQVLKAEIAALKASATTP